jgi:ankyrin repeat protein
MELPLLQIFLREGYQEPIYRLSQCSKKFYICSNTLANEINQIKNDTKLEEHFILFYFQNRQMFNIEHIFNRNENKLNKIGLLGACTNGHMDLFELMAKKVTDNLTKVTCFLYNIHRWDLKTFKHVMILMSYSNSDFYANFRTALHSTVNNYADQIVMTLVINNKNEHLKWFVNERKDCIPWSIHLSIHYGNTEISDYLESIYPTGEVVSFFHIIENWCQGIFDNDYAKSELDRLLRISLRSEYKLESLNNGLEIACRNSRQDLVDYFIDAGASYCHACMTDIELESH